jgi:hypothetical protein
VGTISCSLPAAISDPVNVRNPRMHSSAIAPVRNVVSWPWCIHIMYFATPTSPAASPPNAWESAVRCGTAVSGTSASGMPRIVPTTNATAIHE